MMSFSHVKDSCDTLSAKHKRSLVPKTEIKLRSWFRGVNPACTTKAGLVSV